MTTTNPAIGTPWIDVADCPEDGGRWALYCEHEQGTSVLQDTNKRRLATFKRNPEEWCCYCQQNAAAPQPASTRKPVPAEMLGYLARLAEGSVRAHDLGMAERSARTDVRFTEARHVLEILGYETSGLATLMDIAWGKPRR